MNYINYPGNCIEGENERSDKVEERKGPERKWWCSQWRFPGHLIFIKGMVDVISSNPA